MVGELLLHRRLVGLLRRVLGLRPGLHLRLRLPQVNSPCVT
jgi:hypothetical protein